MASYSVCINGEVIIKSAVDLSQAIGIFQLHLVVQRVARAHGGGAIAIVSHGGVLDGLYRAATGLALDVPRTWPLPNAGINRLLFTPQGLTLVGWNDVAHLDGLAGDATPDRPDQPVGSAGSTAGPSAPRRGT